MKRQLQPSPSAPGASGQSKEVTADHIIIAVGAKTTQIPADRSSYGAFAVMTVWSIFMALLGPYHFMSLMADSARDLAFPRLNLASWYMYMIGLGFAFYAMIAGGVDTGWTFYVPYASTVSDRSRSEGGGPNILAARPEPARTITAAALIPQTIFPLLDIASSTRDRDPALPLTACFRSAGWSCPPSFRHASDRG